MTTDGLSTAHFVDNWTYLLYRAHLQTEEATFREGILCREDEIAIDLFSKLVCLNRRMGSALPDDLQKLAAVGNCFTGGNDLDHFVLWNYLEAHTKS